MKRREYYDNREHEHYHDDRRRNYHQISNKEHDDFPHERGRPGNSYQDYPHEEEIYPRFYDSERSMGYNNYETENNYQRIRQSDNRYNNSNNHHGKYNS